MNYDDVKRTLGQQGYVNDTVSGLAEKLMDAGCDAANLMDAINSDDPEAELRMLKKNYYF